MGAEDFMLKTPLRVVLDTNCVVSALMFPRGRTGRLCCLWMQEAVKPVVCRETALELFRVLSYPKFKLDADEIEWLLSEYLPFTETFSGSRPEGFAVPGLRDSDDGAFVWLASASGASLLVSGDRHLLELRGQFSEFRIVSPAELVSLMEPRQCSGMKKEDASAELFKELQKLYKMKTIEAAPADAENRRLEHADG